MDKFSHKIAKFTNKETNKPTILIVGSGNSVTKINNINFKKYYEIYAINNAWHPLFILSTKFIWCHSTDFNIEGTIHPSNEQKNKINKIITEFTETPHKPNIYTMFLCVLYHIINIYNNKCIIHIIGCDFIYDDEQTHFYGKGGRDPLRFGISILKDELNKTLEINNEIYNLSTDTRSLLPYMRRKI